MGCSGNDPSSKMSGRSGRPASPLKKSNSLASRNPGIWLDFNFRIQYLDIAIAIVLPKGVFPTFGTPCIPRALSVKEGKSFSKIIRTPGSTSTKVRGKSWTGKAKTPSFMRLRKASLIRRSGHLLTGLSSEINCFEIQRNLTSGFPFKQMWGYKGGSKTWKLKV